MQISSPIPRRLKPSEEGYLLLAVMFLMALLVLSLAVAAPIVAKSIQRDREVETMERGKQYMRAIQLYYRKFHAYPPNEDALVKTNEIRFLRKRYLDPITGKDDWKPVMFGQNKAPIAMGFFGQPLATGGALAGIGPSGGNGANGTNGTTTGSFFNSSGGSGFGSSPGSSIFNSSSPSNSPTSSPGSSDGSSGSSTGGTGTTSGSNNGTDANGNSSTAGNTGTGLAGQTFGGAGIIGFSPASPKQSILIYKTKDHYNEWEFTYDPIMDMKMMTGGNTGTIGQPASTTTGAFGIPGITSSGSNTTGSSGTSSNPDSVNTPVTPPETSAPQQ